MTQRADYKVQYATSPRQVIVDDPSKEFLAQDIIDTLAYEQALIDALDDPQLMTSSGKEDLGSGVEVGLTVTLQDTQVGFEMPPSATITGTVTTTDATARYLYDTGANFSTVNAGDAIVYVTSAYAVGWATVSRVITTTQIETTLQRMVGGASGFTLGDSYVIVPTKQCNVTGGNVVAVDSGESAISSVFPTAFTQVLLTASSSATLSGGGGDPGAIANAVWDEAMGDHLGAGSTGEKQNQISTKEDISDQVWDETMADHLGAGSTGEKQNAGADPAAIADQVWNEAMVDHTTPGSTGEKQNQVSTKGDIADQVWDETLADHTTPGSTGEKLDAGADSTAIATAVWNEDLTAYGITNQARDLLRRISVALTNKNVINQTTSEWEFYDDAGTTILFKIGLKDKDGNDIQLVTPGTPVDRETRVDI
jgi:hypothetical protein